MSDSLQYFRHMDHTIALMLPFDFQRLIADWGKLRRAMVRSVPDAFTRDEWAYMLMFLDQDNLMRPFQQTFGQPVNQPEAPLKLLVKPRGEIALWLPNNVSLLGPLMLILISLTGNTLRMKGGTRSENLTGTFRDYVLTALDDCTLKRYLQDQTTIDCFDREDERNREMAKTAKVRLAFSSDEAAHAIESMPHPTGSLGMYFTDKRSEAWMEYDALSDEALDNLIKVFSIFGQAGCTSPRRVVLIGGDNEQATALKLHLLKRWPKAALRVPPHTASENIMARQWAVALGWDAELAANNGAVIAVGNRNLPDFSSHMSLPIVWADLESAVSELAPNIQTIGHHLKDANDPNWLNAIGASNVKRFVPIGNMHHFGPVWDGYGFWRQLFEEIEVMI